MQLNYHFEKIRFNYKIWLSTREGKNLLGDGKWQILKAIEKHGSLKAATIALGLTYRRTWGDLQRIEDELGFRLLAKSRGGAEGGKSSLTPAGKLLVKAFDDFHARADVFMEEAFSNFRKSMSESDGIAG
jgi:molybdate transport system regulatory protein